MIISQVKKRTAKFVFDRYFARHLNGLLAPQIPIALDYAVEAKPRYGYGKQPHRLLYDLLDANKARYRAILQDVASEVGLFRAIAADPASHTGPAFANPFFSGLDPFTLCEMLRRLCPRLYLGLSSRNSSTITRPAISDRRF